VKAIPPESSMKVLLLKVWLLMTSDPRKEFPDPVGL